jgi:hypothetical protein
VFQLPVPEAAIERVAINAKVGGGEVMLGIACGPLIKLWALAAHIEPIRRTLIGNTMTVYSILIHLILKRVGGVVE